MTLLVEPIWGDAVCKLYGVGCGGPSNGPLSDWDFMDDSKTPPTKAECDAKFVEMQAEYDAQEYARNREAEYPTIAELTVALYDTDDKAAIETKRAAVKAKYPKPS